MRRVPTGRARIPLKSIIKQKHHTLAAETPRPVLSSQFSWIWKYKWIFAAVILAGVACGILGFYILPRAVIAVTPRSEPVTRDMEIRIDSHAVKSELSTLVIPGKLITQEVTGKNIFQATGARNIGQKASGFVSIYNFSKTTFQLKAQTTTLTINGKKYFFTQDVSGIRPTAFIGQKSDQEVDLTSLIAPVPIVAEGPGTEYNLPKGARIEISNTVLGSKPDVLYAVASEAVTGGSNKLVPVVTDSDIVKAYDAEVAALVNQTRTDLAAKAPGEKLLDSAVASQILEKQVSAGSGTETKEFEVNVRVSQKALVFNERDVISLIESRIARLLPQTQELVANAQDRLGLVMSNQNLDAGTATLSAHYEGRVLYKIDPADYLTQLRGKTPGEVREILLSQPEIQGVEVKLSPFWVKKTPKFSNKIRIETGTD